MRNLNEQIETARKKYLVAGIKGMDEHEVVLHSVRALEAEVNNGGFEQFYWNSAGDLARETVDSLVRIGAIETSKIVRAANASISKEAQLKEKGSRQDALEIEAVRNKLDLFDDEFWQQRDNLTELLAKYINSI